MGLRKGLVLAAAGAAALSACVPVTSGLIFQPPAHPRHPLLEPRPFRGEELLVERRYGEAGVHPLVEHDIVMTAGGRIAYSIVRVDLPGPLIIHCGGNGTDRFTAGASYADKILRHGDALLFDYPGYGDSGGRVSARKLEAALPDLVGLIAEVRGERPVVYWGHSLGGQVCAEMARLDPHASAMIVEASGPDIARMAEAVSPDWIDALTVLRPARNLHWLDAGASLGETTIPILIIDAEDDRVLPGGLGRELGEILDSPGRIVRMVTLSGAGHLNAPAHPDFHPEVRAFLEVVLAP